MRGARGENRSRGRKSTFIINSPLFPSITIQTIRASEAKTRICDMEIIRSGYFLRSRAQIDLEAQSLRKRGELRRMAVEMRRGITVWLMPVDYRRPASAA